MAKLIRSYAKNVFFIILIVFLLLETGSFFILKSLDQSLGNQSKRHNYSPYRGHELNSQYVRDFDTGGKKIHSQDGFRRDESVQVAKPEGVFRVLVFGGSALYGIGSDGIYPTHRSLFNDEIMTFKLERLINQEIKARGTEKRVEIINCGVTAYKTFQHLIYFYERLFQYQPDFLVFLDGHNDFYILNENYNPMLDYGYSSIHLSNSFNRRSFIFTFYTVARWGGKYSHFFKLTEEVLENLWENYEAVPRDVSLKLLKGEAKLDEEKNILEKTAQNSFLRVYHQFLSLSKLYGFNFHVFLQPEVVFEPDENLSREDQNIKKITEKEVGEEEVSTMKRIRNNLPGIFSKWEIPFSDVGEISSPATKAEKLYFDYCHLSPEGSEQLAKRIYEILFPKLWVQMK